MANDTGTARHSTEAPNLKIVPFQPIPDTSNLRLRRSSIALACHKGVHGECQRKSESGGVSCSIASSNVIDFRNSSCKARFRLIHDNSIR